MKHLFNKLSAFIMMLMCVSATALARVEHHTVCSPTESSRGFTVECWEDTETGKFYSNSTLTQELTGADLAKAVVYAKLPSNPVTGSSEFNVVVSDNTETWDVNLNWAAETTFSNAHDDGWSSTPRYAEFKVKGNDVADARFVWMKNQGDVEQGRYSVKIYVNNEEIYTKTQGEREIFEGVTVQSLSGLKKGDIVRFEVSQISHADWEQASPTFKACLEYTCSAAIVHHYPSEPDLYAPGFTQECWEKPNTGQFFSDEACTHELTDEALFRTVTYMRLPNSPLLSTNGFNYIDTETEGGFTFNWAAKATYNDKNTLKAREVVFTVREEDCAHARLVWHKNIGSPKSGTFRIRIYVNDNEVFLRKQEENEWLSGLFVKSLPNLKRGDQVKFEINMYNATSAGKDQTVDLNFIACLEYTREDIKLPLVISAVDKQKNIGDEEPELTWEITEGDVLSGDNLTGINISREEGENPGTYNINVSQNDGANPDYRITFLKGTFTITEQGKIMSVSKKNGEIEKFSAKTINNITFCEHNATICMAIAKKNGTTTYIAQNDIDNVSWYGVAEDADPTSLHFAFKTPDAPEGLSELSAEGTVGMFNGREAIVVDLGGNIGKVAIATSNVGANVPTENGTKFNYEDANDPTKNGLSNGWYVPSKDELQALLDRLEWIRTGEGFSTTFHAQVSFGNSTLLFPSTGASFYSGNNGILLSQGVFLWSSTPQFFMRLDGGTRTITEDHRVPELYVRLFCKLPRQEGLNLPIETEHSLDGSSLRSTGDGSGMHLTVNGQTVTYPVDILNNMTFFNGTPSVQLHANEDPDNEGNYYTTFYSGLEAYNIPDDVKAYIATVDGDVVKLTEVEGDILPQGEAVLLYSDAISDITLTTATDNGGKSSDNMFSGVDVETEQDGNSNYMLSYGQNKLGFYKMNSKMLLSPNKAFITLASSPARALRMVFADEVDGIQQIEDGELEIENSAIYNLNGMRLNQLQKGINIVNGKKIVK